jgi:putative ABC transport system ATP-binding protein
MSIIVKTQGLGRDFISGGETIQALKEISISVQSGTLTILKGRSGSGKTTLMNLIASLDRPSRGNIYFEGREITHISESERDDLRRLRIGFVYQSVALIPLMTAYENVEFILRLAGYDKKTRKDRAKDCLALVGLQKRMHHLPQELSGGEQQRVAIARAISHKPKLLLADEPTGELDTHLGLQVVKVFKDLVREEGLTVVMSTHDPNMTEIADHVFTLEDGEIIDER